MDGVEVVIVALFVSVVVLAAAARAINVPYPIVLVIGGAILGFVPGLPDVQLDPDLVLVLFLPPLLYTGAFFANLRELRTNLRPIALLSIGLVIATVLVVAWVAHTLIDGLSWPAAFALGAIVGPTDPVAATAILRRLGVPRTLVTVLEGESLVNDATALVAYRIALAAAAGAGFSLLDATWDFVWKAAGGIAIGLIVGWVIAWVRSKLDDPLVENTIGLLSAYAAYVPAEHLDVSAVLAAVTVGCYVGWQAPRIASPATRIQGFGMWELLQFLLNAILFVLVGLQLPVVLDGLDGTHWTTLLGYAAAISAAVVITRMVWQQTVVFLIRAVDRRESVRARRSTWQLRVIGGWAGMRGAVSLAVALALPLDFEQRDLLIFLTFAVIFVTLVLQGLTLAPLIRWLGVIDDGTQESHEELKARLVATKAALARIEELKAEEWTRDDTLDRMQAQYEYRKRRLAARAGKIEDDGYEDRSFSYQTVLREVLEAQRVEVVRLRNQGTISNEVMHRIERELDLEDQRLEI
ncbi:Na+/H+ antiporter [Solirubrobacter ginsenosidimutans]|uniref:Na+/H+ antiporter n=1 Tax=Solirubrobacter ginsenosidimutans TaxID=490573 RepID=A0A9X3MYT8_9ACTN|nr:Na+/H+ antiporter [Solirubrobacter ginsenosidimutans]MDA0163657.1 Na+/H+ antiporter [Solirubrobacter ginsenosidimutans]